MLGGTIDGATRRDLWEMSRGNPLYLRELVLGAVGVGVLEREHDVWRLRGGFASTPRLVELVEARLSNLGADDREALELLALGEPLDLEALEHLGVGPQLLDGLERQGLVHADVEGASTQVRLAHPLHSEVVREGMTAIGRMVTSRRLADAAATTAFGRDIVRSAVWRLEGGGQANPDAMLEAARQTFFAHDNKLAERLARVSIDAGGGLEAGLLLAQVLGALSRHEDRHDLLCELQEQAATDEQLAMVVLERGITLFWGIGQSDRALQILRDAEDRLAPGRYRDEVASGYASLQLFMGRFHEALATVRPIVADDPNSRAAVTAAMSLAPALVLCGRGNEAIGVAETAYAAHVALGTQEVMPDPGVHFVMHTFAHSEMGHLVEAEATAEVGYRASVDSHIREGQAWFALLLGRNALVSGQVAAASNWFREGAAVFADLGENGPRRWCVSGRMLAAAQRGEAEEAKAAANDLDAIGPNPMRMMEPEVLRARGWVAWTQGEPEVALDRLREAARTAEDTGADALAVLAWHDLARLGRPAEAAEPLARLAERVDGDLAQVRADYVAALAAGDPERLESVADRFESVGALLYAAEAASGASAAYRGQDGRAAARLAQRATALVAKCEGADTPALALAGPAAVLTAREREVVTLAASGLTSKEIAGRLMVSVRTVDSHLQRAFTKLGVSSRADLPDALEVDPGL